MKFDTKVVHAGITPDPTTGSILPPIYETATYVLEEVGGFDVRLKIAIDYDLWWRVWRAGRSVIKVRQVLSVMSDEGVSSRRDWPSLIRRFSEERLVQERYCTEWYWKIVYEIYWPLYLGYRRIRALPFWRTM